MNEWFNLEKRDLLRKLEEIENEKQAAIRDKNNYIAKLTLEYNVVVAKIALQDAVDELNQKEVRS